MDSEIAFIVQMKFILAWWLFTFCEKICFIIPFYCVHLDHIFSFNSYEAAAKSTFCIVAHSGSFFYLFLTIEDGC